MFGKAYKLRSSSVCSLPSILSQDTQLLCRESKLVLPEYKAQVLTLKAVVFGDTSNTVSGKKMIKKAASYL
jgi:hypothetical protein